MHWLGKWWNSGVHGFLVQSVTYMTHGMVHGLLVWCMAYWYGAWPTGMVHGLLEGFEMYLFPGCMVQ